MSLEFEKEAIRRFGNDYIINKNNKDEWLFPCKLCNKPNTDNLHVNVRTGLYNCFHNCSNHGKLKKKYSLANLIETNKNENNKIDKIKEEYLIPFIRTKLTKEQKEALYSRGLSDDDIKFYNIEGGKRIQIPNKVIGCLADFICNWEWRKDKISKTNPKYINSNEGIQKSKILFNLHNISYNPDSIILCEGVFNAITAGRNAVASYGCEISDEQIQLLITKKPKNIIIVYDSDLPGTKGTLHVIQKLKNNKFNGNVYYLPMPKGIDVNEMGKEKFLSYLDKKQIEINLSSSLSCNIPKFFYDKNIII